MPKEETDALDVALDPSLDGVDDDPEKDKTDETPEVDEQDDDQLKAVMETYGADPTDDLNGFLAKSISELNTYKKKYGDGQNEIGELRREIKELKDMSRSRRAESLDDDFLEDRGERPATIKEIERWYTGKVNEQSAAQKRAAEHWANEKAKVESQPGYKNIREDYEAALKNPDVLDAFNKGQITPMELYYNLNSRYLYGTIDKLVRKIKGGGIKVGSKTGGETVGGRNVSKETTDEERAKKLKRNVEKKDHGATIESLFS